MFLDHVRDVPGVVEGVAVLGPNKEGGERNEATINCRRWFQYQFIIAHLILCCRFLYHHSGAEGL